MWFTLLFDNGGRTETYDLVYAPCPIWMKDGEQVLVPFSSSPYYKIGSVKKLLNDKKTSLSINWSIKIIIHEGQYGGKECLVSMIDDLLNCGFSPKVYNLDESLLKFLKEGTWDRLNGEKVDIFSEPIDQQRLHY